MFLTNSLYAPPIRSRSTRGPHPSGDRREAPVRQQGLHDRILGLPEDEAAQLLADLLERVKTPEYQVRFRWTPNAIVFWDNRATQHYAILDYWPQERIVERVTIQGDVPFWSEPSC